MAIKQLPDYGMIISPAVEKSKFNRIVAFLESNSFSSEEHAIKRIQDYLDGKKYPKPQASWCGTCNHAMNALEDGNEE